MLKNAYWSDVASEAWHRTTSLIFDGWARTTISVLIFVVIAIISHKARGAEVSRSWIVDGIVGAFGTLLVAVAVFLFYLFVLIPQERGTAYAPIAQERDQLKKDKESLTNDLSNRSLELQRANDKLDTLSIASGSTPTGGLNEKLDKFLSDFDETKRLLKEVEARSPPLENQLIVSVMATVEVRIISSQKLDADYMDRGGYLALCKGTDAIIITSATRSLGNQLGNNTVRYRGVFSADQASIPSDQKVSSLFDTEYIQIFFAMLPERSQILGGRATVVINNGLRMEFDVPAQQMPDNKIFIRDVVSEIRKKLSRG